MNQRNLSISHLIPLSIINSSYEYGDEGKEEMMKEYPFLSEDERMEISLQSLPFYESLLIQKEKEGYLSILESLSLDDEEKEEMMNGGYSGSLFDELGGNLSVQSIPHEGILISLSFEGR